MPTPETLQCHLQVCDELHQLAHEENRQLKEHRRVPAPDLLERKRALLVRLDNNLPALRTGQGGTTASSEQRQLMDKIRRRILQILQFDKENEQLLLRVSLTRGLEPATAPIPVPSPGLLQKIYARTMG
ncbi:MAG: hypothetical protein WCR49_04750 [Opitutae bacterium]